MTDRELVPDRPGGLTSCDPGPATDAGFARIVRGWYDDHARTPEQLPWRTPGTSPWGVLVSEVMLQQTPAARVAPVWREWLSRWPVPGALADEPVGEAVRAWGRLGYPRRALRLHGCAVAIDRDHAGGVPRSAVTLLALPGIGAYTAAAVAAFAFGERHAVLDTNVRRVHARVFDGLADAPTAAPTAAERSAALARVPSSDPGGHGVAVMELGALVCTARAPRCPACPLAAGCRWLADGRPANVAPRAAQGWAGTDRQARGRLLGVLREADGDVGPDELAAAWPEPVQRGRALAGLLADGLVAGAGDGRIRLP